MGGNANAAEAVARSGHGGAPGAATEKQPGILGKRRVSDQAEGMPVLLSRKRPEAGAVAGDTGEQTSLRSRQATAIIPALRGTDSATVPPPGEQAGEPPAASAPVPHLTVGDPSNGSGHADSLARLLAPPGLEPTVLTNAGGVTLFRGLRHDLLVAPRLDLTLLLSLPDDRLKSLLELIEPTVRNTYSLFREIDIEGCFELIRSTNVELAESYARYLYRCASQHMAREVAATALASDPEKCGRAQNGENVDLHFCAVSLLRPVEFEVFKPQRRGFNELTDLDPKGLCLRSPDGGSCIVQANIKIRQFTLSSVGESVNSARFNEDDHFAHVELVRLLGPIEDRFLRGDVGERVDAINARALDSFQTPLSRAWEQIPTAPAPGQGADHADLRQLRLGLASTHGAIEAELNPLTRNSRTLVEAGEQLKTMWEQRSDWPPGADAHLRAGALLLLAAYHMGEIPLLSSANSDLTGRLDAEVKFLATYADSHDGHLPPLDPVFTPGREPVTIEPGRVQNSG